MYLKQLGITPLINAAGTYTAFGGSRPPRVVLEAMEEAASSYVDVAALSAAVERDLARLTRNEGAVVTAGAAAGLYLSIAACVERKLGKPFAAIRPDEMARCEVIVHRAHRNPYDWAVRQLGVRLVEVGYANLITPFTKSELQYALGPETAAILFVSAGGWMAPGGYGLDMVLELAGAADVPVVVDAAAQLPPLENLWRFTEQGASLAVFSGGKDLRGPQGSGMILGHKEFTDRCRGLAFPNYGIGRMLKVGREEMAGLHAAVKRYVEVDHDARRAWCEHQVDLVVRSLSGERGVVRVERAFPNEAGQPLPRAVVHFDGEIDAAELAARMRTADPAVAVMPAPENGIYINPMTLEEGETELVVECVRRVVASWQQRP